MNHLVFTVIRNKSHKQSSQNLGSLAKIYVFFSTSKKNPYFREGFSLKYEPPAAAFLTSIFLYRELFASIFPYVWRRRRKFTQILEVRKFPCFKGAACENLESLWWFKIFLNFLFPMCPLNFLLPPSAGFCFKKKQQWKILEKFPYFGAHFLIFARKLGSKKQHNVGV